MVSFVPESVATLSQKASALVYWLCVCTVLGLFCILTGSLLRLSALVYFLYISNRATMFWEIEKVPLPGSTLKVFEGFTVRALTLDLGLNSKPQKTKKPSWYCGAGCGTFNLKKMIYKKNM